MISFLIKFINQLINGNIKFNVHRRIFVSSNFILFVYIFTVTYISQLTQNK